MKKLTILLFTLLLPACLLAQTDEPQLTKKEEAAVLAAANGWFETAMKGKDLNRLMQLSDVPFAFDGEVISSTSSLKKAFQEIFKDKGQREVPPYTSLVDKTMFSILSPCIPINVTIVKVQLLDDDGGVLEEVLFCVQLKNDTYKVTGLSE